MSRYIENLLFSSLTSFMSQKDVGLCIVNGKIETFALIRNTPVINLIIKEEGDSSSTRVPPSSVGASSIPSSSSSLSSLQYKKTATGLLNVAAVKKVLLGSCPTPPFPQRSRSNSNTNNTTGGVYPCRRYLRGRAVSLGDLGESSSKKLLIDLISTLDDFFPDYDFDTTKPEQFLIKNITQVIQLVNGYLAELTEERPDFLEKLWQGIDDAIDLRKCEAYSLVPDRSEDPFSDGTLWSFNFFFLNHELKQLIYFTCVAKSKFRRDTDMDIAMDEDDEEEVEKEVEVDDSNAMDGNSEDESPLYEEGDSLDEQEAPDW